MSDDLVKRLRTPVGFQDLPYIQEEAADRIEVLTAKLAEVEAERDCATETLEAWFNTKSFARDNIDPRVLDAAEGYLRVSRIGGMENAESDMVKGVIQDMAYKGVFSQVFTEYVKVRERDAYQRGFKAALEKAAGKAGTQYRRDILAIPLPDNKMR